MWVKRRHGSLHERRPPLRRGRKRCRYERLNVFQELEGMIQKAATGEIDSASVGDAAGQHVNAMDPTELQQHVQTAANNAQQNGNTSLAQQLFGLLEQYRANPAGLKSEIINLITNNPQILQQFARSLRRRS